MHTHITGRRRHHCMRFHTTFPTPTDNAQAPSPPHKAKARLIHAHEAQARLAPRCRWDACRLLRKDHGAPGRPRDFVAAERRVEAFRGHAVFVHL